MERTRKDVLILSLRYENDHTFSDNPFIDLLIYHVKVLVFNAIVKDEQTADENETMDTLKESDIYISCIEGTAGLHLFDVIPRKFLVQVGMSEDQIQMYEQDHDLYYIPDKYHEDLIALLRPWYINNYEEHNAYYRMICAMPPKGEPGIPIRDYEYLIPDEIDCGDATYFHEVSKQVAQSLEAAGILDIVRADYPEYKYLNYLSQKISVYEARKKMDFQLLWYPDNMSYELTEEFEFRYGQIRQYVLSTIYSAAMTTESPYYHSFLICYILLATMIDMIVNVQSHIIKKDILDRRCIEYIFSMYGVPYYKIIPLKYQKRMCKNVNDLVKYKSCTVDMLNLASIFGFKDLGVFKWFLLKVRKRDAWGELLYSTKETKTCLVNNIVGHDTVEESMSEKPARGHVPEDLQMTKKYYEGTGIADDYHPGVITVTSDITGVTTQEGGGSVTATDVGSGSGTVTLKENERFIPFPFDYFLQRGNKMFVIIDGYILQDGIDYTIHSYNVIRFLTNVYKNKSKITYEFFYDKDTMHEKIEVDKDHCIQTIQEKLIYNGKRKFSLSPVPIKNYFKKENQLIVSVDSVWLDYDMYKIDYDEETLTITDDELELDSHTDITVVYIYSKHLKSRFEKYSTVITQDNQDKIYIPEPFRYYVLNGNTFFITYGTTYIEENRYTVTPSTTKGQAYIQFIDKTPLRKGMRINFHFLYSTNALYSGLHTGWKRQILYAQYDYQDEFELDFPVEHYVENGYLVYVKILGAWIPQSFYTIVGNRLVFLNKAIGIMKGREIRFYMIYMDQDRTVTLNLKVGKDYRAATKKKQKTFDIKFPTNHYFTKGNKLIVDVNGTPLTEVTDYYVTCNSDESAGTLKIKNYDYRPLQGQKINYTFFYNKEADYFLKMKTVDVDIEKTNNEEFTIPFPFYPYFETNQDFLLIIGTTLITKNRINMTSRFTFKILGIDPAVIGRKITFIFIYNSWYEENLNSALTVEWKKQYIDRPYIDIATPFEYYIEKQWPWMVSYGNRLILPDEDFDVYNSRFYTYPPEDLEKKKYGDFISFIFIYTTKSPWVKTGYTEDYEANNDLYFCKTPIDTYYPNQSFKDKTNWRAYDPITLQDGWWDGRKYRQNSHEYIKHNIYLQKFNYSRTKYYGVLNEIDLGEYSSQMSFFYSMLFDDVFMEKKATLIVPTISPSHPFNIAHLFLFMTSMNFLFNDIEDYVLTKPEDYLWAAGFNFRADLDALKKYVQLDNHHDAEKDFPIWNFITEKTTIEDFKQLVDVFKNNYAVRKVIMKGMVNAEGYKEYKIWSKLYDSMLRWKYNTKYFTMSNGNVATTYKEFLQDAEPVLYDKLVELGKIEDMDKRQDDIIELCDEIIYLMQEYMQGDEFKYIFDGFPGHSSSYAAKYLHMMIDFFKSYKVCLLDRCEQMDLNDPNDPGNYFRGVDDYDIHEESKVADAIPPIVEKLDTIENFELKEWAPYMVDDHQAVDYPILDAEKSLKDNTKVKIYTDPIVQATNIFQPGKWMNEDVMVELADRDRVQAEFKIKMTINKIFNYSYIKVRGMNYTRGIRNASLQAKNLVLNYEKYTKNIIPQINLKMADYEKREYNLPVSLYCDNRLFLDGYKMMQIYQPIYQEMTNIPETDCADITNRLDDRVPNDNIEQVYADCLKLQTIPPNISYTNGAGMLKWNNLTNFACNCPELVTVDFQAAYFKDDNNDKQFNRMFYNCPKLLEITPFELSEYSDSTGTVYFNQAFKGDTAYKTGLNYIRSSRDLYMEECFAECKSMVTAPKIETGNGSMYMTKAFSNCSKLMKLPVMVFGESSSVIGVNAQIHMEQMFENCDSLIGEDTEGATDLTFRNDTAHLTQTFVNCTSMEKTPRIVGNNATVRMENTFEGCTGLKYAYAIKAINGSTIYMDSTFEDCSNLETVYGMNINGNSTVHLNNTYEGCSKINQILNLIPTLSDNSKIYMRETFKDCTSITKLVLNASNLYSVDGIVKGCTGLTEIVFKDPNASIVSDLTHAKLDGGTLSYTITIQ